VNLEPGKTAHRFEAWGRAKNNHPKEVLEPGSSLGRVVDISTEMRRLTSRWNAKSCGSGGFCPRRHAPRDKGERVISSGIIVRSRTDDGFIPYVEMAP
jgi:hypothetical protein